MGLQSQAGDPHRQWARVQALRQRGMALATDRLPADEVLDSWVRCVDAGLDATQRVPVQVVDAAELRRRREQAGIVRQLAGAEMEILSQQIAGSNFLLAFADRDCVILDLVQDNRFVMSNETGILAGSCWSEALCGTNGLGTARIMGRSVAVTGQDHFFHDLGRLSCTAAPVHDTAGDVVGVLDASSFFESRQQHTQALVQMAASHVENRLLLHEMRAHWVLAVHPRPEYLGTLSVGLMAFDEAGCLRAANARARQMLQGLPGVRGSAFEELFDEPFERVWPRLARGGELRLRDHLGSGLIVRCLNRPLGVPDPARAVALPPSGLIATGGAARLPDRTAAAPVGALAAARSASSLNPGPASVPVRPSADAMRAEAQGADAIGAATRRRGAQGAVAAAAAGDEAVRAAYAMAARASRLRVPILIQGETGTGKELLARHVHEASGRAGPLVAVNCGAMPQELFEAELFGHAPGAFTGARREGSPGLIASADGGTLLLDELGELPAGLQAALLRFLDDQCVRPLGAVRGRQVDVQLVAATNCDLQAEVAARRFRADLFYRLNTVCVSLPPLRDRQDLVDCAASVLVALQPDARLGADAAPVLLGHAWPGNFRELRSVLARALLLAEGPWVDAAALRAALGRGDAARVAEPPSVLQQITRERVRQEFARRGNSVSATARALGVSRTTVYRHIR